MIQLNFKLLRLLLCAALLSLSLSLPTFAVEFETEIISGFLKENAIKTEHFRFEFSNLIMNQLDLDESGIADLIEITADSAEKSWSVIVDELGYDSPIDVDGDRVFVVLDETEEYLIEGALGITGALSTDEMFVAIDPWLPNDYLTVTMAHEFFHVIQFSQNIEFATYSQGINWAESTANWVQDLVHETIDEYVDSLPDFFSYADYSVFASVKPSDTLFEYGLNIWPRFLGEYLEDNGVVKEIWDEYLFESDREYSDHLRLYESVERVLEKKDKDLREAFREFTVWNMDLSNYEEGELYPDVSAIFDLTLNEYTLIEDEYAPALYGTNYLYFENIDLADEFNFEIIKGDGVSFAVTLVAANDGFSDLSNQTSLILDNDVDMDSKMVLAGIEDYNGVVAVISPLDIEFAEGENDYVFDEGYLYYYYAKFGEEDEEDEADEEEVQIEVTEEQGVEEKEGSETVFGEVDDLRVGQNISLSVLNFDEESVNFSWNRSSDESVVGYNLWYGADLDYYSEVVEVNAAHTTFGSVDGLNTGTPYYFLLVSVNEEGEDIEESAEVVVIPEKWIFTDVSFFDDHHSSISGLTDLGIFDGHPDGSFKPNDAINRAELLKILIEGRDISPNEAVYNNCFTDVGDEWFAKYVCYASHKGWVKGYEGGEFRPGDTVSKVEALKMLFEVYEAGLTEGEEADSLVFDDLENDDWFSIYVEAATELGILEEDTGGDFNAHNGRNRGAMAEELYRYLVETGEVEKIAGKYKLN